MNEERNEEYRKLIETIIRQIEDTTTLMKIYTTAHTHLRLLREREGQA